MVAQPGSARRRRNARGEGRLLRTELIDAAARLVASSDRPEDAQRLVQYLTDRAAQERLADSSALEYAVGTGVDSAEALPPLAELEAPDLDPGELSSPEVTALMQEVGLL